MKKIVSKIFKDICIAYMVVSLFLAIAVIFETKHEEKVLLNNLQVEQMPFIETINEQIKIYNENINNSKTEAYSSLLSSLEFLTTILPLASLFGAIVMALVYEVAITIINKSSTNKLNEQLKRHQ